MDAFVRRHASEVTGTLSGWDRLRFHNHRLALFGRDLVSGSLGVQPPVPAEATGSMALVELPEGITATKEAAEAVQARLYERSRIEVPFVPWNGRVYVRLSAQVYNRPSDYEHLAEELPGVIPR